MNDKTVKPRFGRGQGGNQNTRPQSQSRRGMLTPEEKSTALLRVNGSLVRAYLEIRRVADMMEARLSSEAERAGCEEYGRLCRVMGALEEQVEKTENQLDKIK